MKLSVFAFALVLVALLACHNPGTESGSLADARRGFVTQLVPQNGPRQPLYEPPAATFSVVHYTSAVGELPAYLSPDPGDGKKHPAIVWITGGDCNSLGDVWNPRGRESEESASQYREAGIVMMFPSLRGGNHNPGRREGFLGEVDDVLAATVLLEKQPYVDRQRIYLGGHSTGGTLVLLVAEVSPRYRAVFSFGPIKDPRNYMDDLYTPYSDKNPREWQLRAPGRWLESVTSPTFVIEGEDRPGNPGDLRAMSKSTNNPNLHFVPVANADHFTVLAPVNELIAKKILADTGKATNINVTKAELDPLFKN